MASKVMKKVTKRQLAARAVEDAVTVDRKFLMRLANSIYNPRNQTYLRLCNGTLQNGPDPKNQNRPMHCGLGELYFAVTGFQPEETGVSEDDVIRLVVKKSTVNEQFKVDVLAARAAVKRVKAAINEFPIKIDAGVIFEDLMDQVNEAMRWDADNAEGWRGDMAVDLSDFRDLIADIQDHNDGVVTADCSITDFKARSVRVATQLRKAAKLLPY